MDKFITIEASLSLINTLKESPIITGYRPNHIFDTNTNKTYIGEIITNNPIYPNHTQNIIVNFLYNEDILQYIKVNQIWTIKEGTKYIGTGTITNIIGHYNIK